MKKIYLIAIALLTVIMAQAGPLKVAAGAVTIHDEGTIVTPPSDIEPALYAFKGYDTYVKRDKESQVFVVKDGNDVYIQGLSVDYLPSAWVKGTLADGVVKFEPAYMGSFDFWGDTYQLNFDGAEFAYDEAANTYTATAGYTTTAEGEVLDEYINVVLTGVVPTPATPAQPQITAWKSDDYGHFLEMTVPVQDVDGNDLFAALLSYQILYNKGGETGVFEFTEDNYVFLGVESMTTVPYNFTDSYDIDKGGKQIYIYSDDLEQWTAIGAKSIYTVGDVTNESDVFWYSLSNTAITHVNAATQVIETRYYDLQGRPIDEGATGLVIKQSRMSDGTITTVKTLNR